MHFFTFADLFEFIGFHHLVDDFALLWAKVRKITKFGKIRLACRSDCSVHVAAKEYCIISKNAGRTL